MSHRHGSCNTDNVFMWYYTSESKYRYIRTLHVVFPYSLENYNMHFHFHRERTSNSTVLFWQRILQTSKSFRANSTKAITATKNPTSQPLSWYIITNFGPKESRFESKNRNQIEKKHTQNVAINRIGNDRRQSHANTSLCIGRCIHSFFYYSAALSIFALIEIINCPMFCTISFKFHVERLLLNNLPTI